MKKVVIGFLLCSTLLLAACSNNKKAESTDSTSKQEVKASAQKDLKKKEAAKAKKLATKAEKKKQEEISKKVLEADTAMKTAEANPTDSSVAAAKTAFDSIPGGNPDLKKRLDAITAKLSEIKEQDTVQPAQNQQTATVQPNQNQQQQAYTAQPNQNQQQQSTNPDPNFIDADGNGFDDRSEMNDDAKRAQSAAAEAEANRQAHQGQDNLQNGVDPNGNPLLPGQDHAAGSNPDGTPDAWVKDQEEWSIENGYSNPDGTPTAKGQKAIDDANNSIANANKTN